MSRLVLEMMFRDLMFVINFLGLGIGLLVGGWIMPGYALWEGTYILGVLGCFGEMARGSI
jgi:hypothetical protein